MNRPPQSVSLTVCILFLALATAPLEGCSCSEGYPGQEAGVEAGVEAGPDVTEVDASEGGTEPSTCGNGVFDEFEVCEPSSTTAVDPRLRCDCDDGNACTLDRCKAGTSAEDCTCECENIAQNSMYEVGTCDDGDSCTNDIVACADPSDPRTPMDCAGTCEISCTNPTLPQCLNICGNGVINPGETCEVFVPDVTEPGTPSCTCNDNNPCTIDAPVYGDPAMCNLVCSHTAIGGSVYGVTTCNDNKPCTHDTILFGSPGTCDVVCQHAPVDGWAQSQCNDNSACTEDAVISSTVSTDPAISCAASCSHVNYTGYPYEGCNDGAACTTDSIVRFDQPTCQYVCNHMGNSGYGITDCDDSNVCTIDSITSGSAASCNVVCAHQDTTQFVDDPDIDATFDDTNCDGIDGDADSMVFVAKNGHDTNGNGTRTNPFLTIGRGVMYAYAQGIPNVAVSLGTYDERVVMQNGVSIHGGYDRGASNQWTRSTGNTTTISVSHTNIVGGRVEAVYATNIGSRTRVNRFVIAAGSPTNAPPTPGTSVYGVRVVNSTPGVGGGFELHNVSVSAGRGANGANGNNGGTGQGGNTGGTAPGRNPGDGAVRDCGGGNVEYTRGGTGGWGGQDTGGAACWGANDGSPGGAPPGHTGCGVGYGGDAASGCGSDGSNAGGPGSSSCVNPGGTGTPASGISTRGTVASGAWSPTAGQANAGRGGHGVGGSGGGGGGSGNCDTICTGPDGGGGGGGGSGGCGGYAGTAGTGGGGSFGLFVVDSSIVTLGSTFSSSNGGNGGVGGAGGGGGGGGAPGGGRGGSCPNGSWAINARCSSGGGNGGWGREGGQAGGSGGGAGGPSVAQFICRGTASGTSGATGTAGGAGGAGAGGGPNGPSGPAGTASDIVSVTGSCDL